MSTYAFYFQAQWRWIDIFIPFLFSPVCISTHILLSRKSHRKSYNSNLILRQVLIGKDCTSIKYYIGIRGSVGISESDSSDNEI